MFWQVGDDTCCCSTDASVGESAGVNEVDVLTIFNWRSDLDRLNGSGNVSPGISSPCMWYNG